MVTQEELQRQQSCVIEVLAHVTGEGGRLEELHNLTIRSTRMVCNGRGSAWAECASVGQVAPSACGHDQQKDANFQLCEVAERTCRLTRITLSIY